MARFLQLTSETIDAAIRDSSMHDSSAGDGDGVGDCDGESDGTTAFVHCSGGVGRSGTFMSVLVKWRQLLATPVSRQGVKVSCARASLVPIVTKLREQRHPWAVEGFEQYQFAYQLLAHLVGGVNG